MSNKSRVPSYCIHTARNQAYIRLNGEMIYLGAPDSPESKQKYDRLIAEWLSAGLTHVTAAQRASISVNEVLLAYRRYAETYYVNPDGTHTPELERIDLAIAPVTELYGMAAGENFGPKALKAVVLPAGNAQDDAPRPRTHCPHRTASSSRAEALSPP